MIVWPIKRVEQKGPTCTIACAAMILGIDFEVAEKHFHPEKERTFMTLANYLGDHNYCSVIKELVFHSDPYFGRDEITRPFAPAHVLHLKQFADDDHQHVVVMDQNGKLFDPAQENCDLDDFYMVTGVLGIWRPCDLV